MITQIIYLLSWPALIIAAWVISWKIIKHWEKKYENSPNVSKQEA